MANVSTISFMFKAAATLNLEDLRSRAGSPTMRHLFEETLNLYEEYLIARDAGCKLVMTHPDHADGYEIDDAEHPVNHKPVGIVTLTADLTRANQVAARGGFVATQNMLTHAFMLRERVTEAFEQGWDVGYFNEQESRIQYYPRARFCLMDSPAPTMLQ
jgi:hypothetical protein